MAADLLARRRFSRPQDHRDRTAGSRIIDVDRQEAALVVMAVEERELLMAVNDIERVFDVEGDALGRRSIARQPQIDQHPTQAEDSPEVGQVLQPRACCRLRAQVRPAVGQPPAGELEGRVGAQPVEIVGVLVAAGDGKMRARRMSAMACFTRAGSRGSWIAAASLSASCRRRSAVARSMTPPSEVMRPPSKAAVIFLRPMAGNENGSNVSSVMAGVAREMWAAGQASTTESYAISIA